MTEDILKILADSTKERIEFQKRQISLKEMKHKAQHAKSRSSFLKTLNEQKMSCICEVKSFSFKRIDCKGFSVFENCQRI